MSRVSKEKNAEYFRAWYQRNKELQKQRVKERCQKIREQIDEIKSLAGCNKCGEKHPKCLDFHHKSTDKLFSISQSRQKGWSLERIMIEINKCEIICSNCHRKLHHG